MSEGCRFYKFDKQEKKHYCWRTREYDPQKCTSCRLKEGKSTSASESSTPMEGILRGIEAVGDRYYAFGMAKKYGKHWRWKMRWMKIKEYLVKVRSYFARRW